MLHFLQFINFPVTVTDNETYNFFSSTWKVTTLTKFTNSQLSVDLVDDLGNVIGAMNRVNTNSKEYSITTDFHLGDVDYNSTITENDVNMVMSYIAKNIEFSTLQKELADYNNDGKINLFDVTGMQMELEQ